MSEGNYRQRFFWGGWSSAFEEFVFLGRSETFAHVVVSNDRSFRTEGRVAAGVIAVPVRVEHKLQLAFAQSL